MTASEVKTILAAALLIAHPGLLALANEADREISVTRLTSVFTERADPTDARRTKGRKVMTCTLLVAHDSIRGTKADSISVTEAIPPSARLIVTDLEGRGSGPVRFDQGQPSSGLTYSFLGLGSTSDNLLFSNDRGATFVYTPKPGRDGTDPDVTHVGISPKGVFAPRSDAGLPSFQLKFRSRIRSGDVRCDSPS